MKKQKKVLVKNKAQAENKNTFVSVLKKTLKIIGYVLGGILTVAVLLFIYINLPVAPSKDSAQIGVTFSMRYAQDIGLDWKQAYIAMLDDLKIRYIRLPVYWDLVEKNPGEYDFSDLDWQLDQANQRGAHVILTVGQKVPRWPECFIPKWVAEKGMVKDDRLLSFVKVVVERYKNNHPEIARWQVENEPFLDFGICPLINPALLDSEIAEVKSLDSSRPIVISDSGELSLWLQAAKRADIFGTTMYREVYSVRMGHWRYPIGPNFFKLKLLLIKLFAHQNNAIVVELQGEPWVQGWTTAAPVATQLASMNATVLADNVEFAKKTDMHEIYVWGAEWWYWMKTEQNNPTLWETAKGFNAQNF